MKRVCLRCSGTGKLNAPGGFYFCQCPAGNALYQKIEERYFLNSLREVDRSGDASESELRVFHYILKNRPEDIADAFQMMLRGDYGDGARFIMESLSAQIADNNVLKKVIRMIGAVQAISKRQSEDLFARLDQDEREVLRKELQRWIPASIRATNPHGRCATSSTCVEHANDRTIPSCKTNKGRHC